MSQLTRYGLIGKSLSHSFSQKYFSEKFIEQGLTNHEYDLIELQSIDDIKNIEKTNLRGLNVTIPYKQEIIPYLDEISPEADSIGAVNTVKIIDSKMIGFNTDIYGFERSIKPFLEGHHDRALILGTGGASLAVSYVLKKYGIPHLFVSRSETRNDSILWQNINKYVLQHHKMIINCTPIGMFPNEENSPEIDFNFITEQHFIVDLIYNPEETLFLKKAKEKGAITLNGLSMLKLQAEKSWEIWNK